MSFLSDETLNRLRGLEGVGGEDGRRYRVLETIGRGGMGTVYLAEEPRLERKVALKALDVDDETGDLAARLIREAKVLARLEHPGIVPIHDVGELPDGRVFYAMKYVDGKRLDHYVERGPTLADRLRTFVRICEAVAFAHSRDILHRDLKPQNIMVGSFGEVLVMDWGVAKVLGAGGRTADGETLALPAALPEPAPGEPRPTEHGAVLGTPGYMAPEQARGEVGDLDPRADVYSLGAVLRFLLSGQPGSVDAETAVFETGSRLAARATDGALPRRLRAVVDKAMSNAAGERYPSAVELAKDVQRFLEGHTVSALPESVWVRSARFVSKHRVAFVLILTYVVVRLGVVLFLGR